MLLQLLLGWHSSSGFLFKIEENFIWYGEFGKYPSAPPPPPQQIYNQEIWNKGVLITITAVMHLIKLLNEFYCGCFFVFVLTNLGEVPYILH